MKERRRRTETSQESPLGCGLTGGRGLSAARIPGAKRVPSGRHRAPGWNYTGARCRNGKLHSKASGTLRCKTSAGSPGCHPGTENWHGPQGKCAKARERRKSQMMLSELHRGTGPVAINSRPATKERCSL
ncbi:hypothetical protein NDU88_001050 [Pleurodeles waltl]|uniref:Uncharacterized protein n=1 Tax=Pleurodeles waltl TaxID=8319 RepID=A0AAV7MKQ2_PLEWA|nr:hypothetical protein NDU88_001050 [Pleurodeles waltl]